jgi:hypothetical protein
LKPGLFSDRHRHGLGLPTVREMIDARNVTMASSGRLHGTYGTAPCPVCQPEARPDQCALTLRDGEIGLLVHCKKAACTFREIIAALRLAPSEISGHEPRPFSNRNAGQLAESARRAAQALAIWEQSEAIGGTIAETYLRRRGITCELPNTLRFNGEAWHGPTKRCWPAIVARLDGTEGFAVHRTFICSDGAAKAAIDPPKAMLGATARGAVRLSNEAERLVVAEGIETALSLLCGLLPGSPMVWAALSASGLRSLRLPPKPKRLTIAQDGDLAGRVAAQSLAIRARAEGWTVDFMDPGDGFDFNDVLLKRRSS